MVPKTTSLLHLPNKLGKGVTVEQVQDLLRQLGWDEAQVANLSSKVDEGTLEKLLAMLGKGDIPQAPVKVKSEAPKAAEKPKVEAPKAARRPSLRAGEAKRAGEEKIDTPLVVKPSQAKKAAIKSLITEDDERATKKKKVEEPAPVKTAGEIPQAAAARAAAVKTAPPKPKDKDKQKPAAKPDQKPAQPAVEKPEAGKVDEKKGVKGKVKSSTGVQEKAPERVTVPPKRKIKVIGRMPEDTSPVRSRKRVFKIKGVSASTAVLAPKPAHAFKITGEMSVRDISAKTGVKVGEIISFLLKDLNVFANINHVVSEDEIQLVADHFSIAYEVKHEEAPEDVLDEYTRVSEEKLVSRSPVVTVMGHVDHGKTKLLDRIRHTNVVAQESGGITQHIGAYQIEYKGRLVTFLDTPGHAAFTQMRARGSQVTDIVILVVACDDGVKPQTKEAIEHARAANVPIIVALNKIDLPSANPDRTMSQVSELGLAPEEWGGDTVFAKVSALTGEFLDDLLEMVLIRADLLNLRADPTAPGYGVVIESQITTGQGIIATALVVQGTLRRGQYLVCGTSTGRIKRMEDEWGGTVDEAAPSRPVRIIGFTELPQNGDKIFTFSNKRQASDIVDTRRMRERIELQKSQTSKTSLEDFYIRLEKGEVKDLNLVLKCDVGGSEEAILAELSRIDVEGTKVCVLSHGVGQINENDVMLASASDATILGFSTSLTSGAKKLAEQEKVDVRLYDIIYQMSDDIRKAMLGLLEPVYEEYEIGRIEVREVFRRAKDSAICGGYVLDGRAERGKKFRLKRVGEQLYESTLRSLRRFKDDVRDVTSGYECGFAIEGFSGVEPGDIMHFYDLKEVPRV